MRGFSRALLILFSAGSICQAFHTPTLPKIPCRKSRIHGRRYHVCSLQKEERKEQQHHHQAVQVPFQLTRAMARRSFLAAASVFASSPVIAEEAQTASFLSSRFSGKKIRSLGPASLIGPPDTPVPNWLVGTWDVSLTYKGSSFPLGKSFAEFKQLLAGSVRSPGEKVGSQTSLQLRWVDKGGGGGAVEDTRFNIASYYGAFSKEVTVDTAKGAKTRSVSWMPILTQRGVFEKVNSVESSSRNSWQAVVKEIAPDLGVVGTCPMEGAVVNRRIQESGKTFVQSELTRIIRKSQGKVKMVETGTGDTETLTEYKLSDEGTVTGRHRVLVYLVPFPGPAGDLYADSEGRAVAVYDWELSMKKVVS